MRAVLPPLRPAVVHSIAAGSLTSGPDPLRNITVAGSFALKDPGQVEAGDLHGCVAAFRAAFEEQKDETLRRRAGTSGDERGVGAERFVDEALHGPGAAAVKAGPDSHPFPVSASGVGIAENQDIVALHGQSRQSALHSVAAAISAAVRENLTDSEIFPGPAAVVAPGFPAHGFVRPQLAGEGLVIVAAVAAVPEYLGHRRRFRDPLHIQPGCGARGGHAIGRVHARWPGPVRSDRAVDPG